MSAEALKALRSYDDAPKALDFHHIPARKVGASLEFALVKDLQPEEILDYCILHGDSAADLVIQSFFNFRVQKFTKLRLVTTMCDTIACFLGLKNDNPLAKHPLLKGLSFGILLILAKCSQKSCSNISRNALFS